MRPGMKGGMRDVWKKMKTKRAVSERTVFEWRIDAVRGFFVLLACVLVLRSVHLQVMDGEFLRGEGKKRALRELDIKANRGMILDRNGVPLAVSTATTTVWMNPKQLIEKPERWALLAKASDLSEDALSQLIEKNKTKEFIYLKRHLAPEEASAILKLKVAGVYGMTEYRRFYPHGEVTAHLTGFTDVDHQGREGIELAYDQKLNGQSGLRRVVRDRTGKVIEDLGVQRLAQSGQNVSLSLDLRMQYFTYRALLKGVQNFQADSAMAIALDVKTGEVLAMVSQPAYNPNNRKTFTEENMRNRALTDVFEPGSTVKPFTVLAGLESGQYSPWTPIETTPGFYRVGNRTVRDHHNYGLIDVTTVITKSSNIGSSKIALSLPPETLVDTFRRVGLGESLSTGFPGERGGSLPHRKKWADIQVATLSFGYGMEVTALQLVGAYAVLANGGVKMPIRLVKSAEEVVGERVMDADHATSLVRMLETVTGEDGTAQAASLNGFRVAGKTGTVHKVENGRYVKEYRSLFAGFAPVEKPEIAMVVVVDNPRGKKHYGGEVAAPIFADVMNHLLRVKNAVPDKTIQPIQALMIQPGHFAVR